MSNSESTLGSVPGKNLQMGIWFTDTDTRELSPASTGRNSHIFVVLNVYGI